MDKLITVKDFAKQECLSRAAVWRFIKKNNIKPIKVVGRTQYFNQISLEISNFTKSETIEIKNNEFLEHLKTQISEKDKQIKIKDEQIAMLQKIIDQQQKLRLFEQSKKKELGNKKTRKFLFWLKR